MSWNTKCPECAEPSWHHSAGCVTGTVSKIINTSVDDARHTVNNCSHIDVLEQALKREEEGANRTTLVNMIKARLRKVGEEGGHEAVR